MTRNIEKKAHGLKKEPNSTAAVKSDCQLRSVNSVNSPSSSSALWHKHFPHVTVCEIQSRRWLGGAPDKTNGVGTLVGLTLVLVAIHLCRITSSFQKRQADQDILRCPGTLFISHENANFLFSVFRVVQGEAKTPKIMGCCRANFAFLHTLKIGTFRGKWTLEWVIKTSHFALLALYFLITSKLAFSLIASQRCPARTAKKCLS